jgi:hypothetical protein
MKLWNKTSNGDFGETILTWRYRDVGRFVGKIFSWLLGAFVFGILTSIFFLAIQKPDLSLPLARLVFFIVFIIGIASNFFRAIIYGYEFQIAQKAIVTPHPFFGWEKLGIILGSEEKPFRHVNYFINWDDMKEIREVENGIVLLLKNENEIELLIKNVTELTLNLNLKKNEPRAKGSSKSDKLAYDKAVAKIVLQTARETRRDVINAQS